ncbi:MAG: helicase HerA-like domain-containing protein [Planctomycetota bacterium]
MKLSSQFPLPSGIETMKLAILGRTGSGKTNTAVVMAEQMIAGGVPVAIIDPQGDWWGLRSKYSIAILGGSHADVPLEPTGGSIAADFVINERIPVLLDLFAMGEGEMVRFATDFAKRLWTKNRDALHLFLDEADLFAPQKGVGADKAKCLGAWQNVCRRGRSRGLGLTMITQRSAVINKDLLTQADPLVVHRMTAPQDLNAIAAYVDHHGYGAEFRKDITANVAKLPVGEAIVISPGEMEIRPTRVSVSKRKSFDSSATPTMGSKRGEPKTLAEVDLSALQESMAETIENAKQSDPKHLKATIRELEAKVRQLEKANGKAEIDKAAADRDRHWRAELSKVQEAHASVVSKATRAREMLTLNGDASVEVRVPPSGTARRNAVSKRPTPKRVSSVSQLNLPKGEGVILTAIAQFGECQRSQLTVLTGYKRSSRDAYIQRLKEKGLVESGVGAAVRATQQGVDALGSDFEPLPVGDELRDYWRDRLPAGERAIFECLEVEGGAAARDLISEVTGYKRSSRDAYIQRLKAKLLVETDSSGVTLSENLYE